MNNEENKITISLSFNYKCDEHVKTEGMPGKSNDDMQVWYQNRVTLHLFWFITVRFIFIVELRGENFPTVFPLFRGRQKNSSAGLRFHEVSVIHFSITNFWKRWKSWNPLNLQRQQSLLHGPEWIFQMININFRRFSKNTCYAIYIILILRRFIEIYLAISGNRHRNSRSH